VQDKLAYGATALSGGQQQRLCIARAIAVEPELILMDEPCSAIGPVATAKIEDLIEMLRESYTVVLVTHNMQQAARVSDFTAFFYQGGSWSSAQPSRSSSARRRRRPRTTSRAGSDDPRRDRMTLHLRREVEKLRKMLSLLAALVEESAQKAVGSVSTGTRRLQRRSSSSTLRSTTWKWTSRRSV